jgi:Tfp pilus assembly protein PilO
MSLEGKDIINAAKKHPLVFACAGVILVLLGMMYWRAGTSAELQAKVDERSAVLQKNKTNVNYAVNLDSQLRALTEVNQRIQATALRPDDLPQNQQIFYRMEAATGVKLMDTPQQRATAVNTPKGAVALTYVPVIFSLTVEGDYRQILNFTRQLETGPVISRVAGATLSLGGNNIPSLNLTIEMLGLRQ